jgi:hypothetical protein
MRDLLLVTLTTTVMVLLASGSVAETRPAPSDCTYEMQIWNVNLKQSVNAKQVRHPYAELIPAERWTSWMKRALFSKQQRSRSSSMGRRGPRSPYPIHC